LRGRFAEASQAHPDDADFLRSPAVIDFFRDVFKQHNADQRGSSSRFERFALLLEPPGIDGNETTDKGYINQSAVLTRRADLVEKLYSASPPPDVVVVDAA